MGRFGSLGFEVSNFWPFLRANPSGWWVWNAWLGRIPNTKLESP